MVALQQVILVLQPPCRQLVIETKRQFLRLLRGNVVEFPWRWYCFGNECCQIATLLTLHCECRLCGREGTRPWERLFRSHIAGTAGDFASQFENGNEKAGPCQARPMWFGRGMRRLDGGLFLAAPQQTLTTEARETEEGEDKGGRFGSGDLEDRIFGNRCVSSHGQFCLRCERIRGR